MYAALITGQKTVESREFPTRCRHRHVAVEPLRTSTASLRGFAGALADLASGTTNQAKVLVNPNW